MSSTEIPSTPETRGTDLTYRERVVSALRRRALGQTGVVKTEEVDEFIDSVRRLGFSRVTIPNKSSKLVD